MRGTMIRLEAGVAMEGGEELLVVGRVVAPQGLRGELRVLPLSDFPERFTRAGRRWLRRSGQAAQPVELLGGRDLPGKELFVVRFEGVNSREAAEALVGQELLVRSDDRPRLRRGEFHVMDLVGLEVRLLSDGERRIGRVIDLHHAGNDLLEVELDAREGEGGRRVLVPFVGAIVPRVEPAEGWVGLTPPPGLLDL
jgi:16S rRNA processing protein RimM